MEKEQIIGDEQTSFYIPEQKKVVQASVYDSADKIRYESLKEDRNNPMEVYNGYAGYQKVKGGAYDFRQILNEAQGERESREQWVSWQESEADYEKKRKEADTRQISKRAKQALVKDAMKAASIPAKAAIGSVSAIAAVPAAAIAYGVKGITDGNPEDLYASCRSPRSHMNPEDRRTRQRHRLPLLPPQPDQGASGHMSFRHRTSLPHM